MAKKVLVLWHGGCAPENLQPVLIQLKEEWSSQEAEVSLEHVERLTMACYPESTFDVVLCGVVPPVSFIHSNELLEEIARVMKPSGILTIKEPVVLNVSLPPLRSRDKLISALKFSGFINVQESSPLILADQTVLHILGESIVNITRQEISIATIQAKTPSYETGASTVLSFGSRISTQQQSISSSSNVAQIWSLSANDTMDDDLDLMDSDTLLLEEDLVRPNPESLKSSCGLNSGKRKACKNCSCGLAEQLTDDSSSQPIRTVTSSCGNCYLGDAFRCASCPYLGMPAFKSGEQIKLTDRQLNVDQ